MISDQELNFYHAQQYSGIAVTISGVLKAIFDSNICVNDVVIETKDI